MRDNHLTGNMETDSMNDEDGELTREVESMAPRVKIDLENSTIPVNEESKTITSDEETEDFYGFDLSDMESYISSRSILRMLIARAELSRDIPFKRPQIKLTIKKAGNNISSAVKELANYNAYDAGAVNSGSAANHSGTNELLQNNKHEKHNQSPGMNSINVVKTKSDLSNPAFREPFNYGWKRELVYRASATGENQETRMADIYYYTPDGKKVRSSREILKYLTAGNLSLDNFTFFKESLNVNDPSKEIIREAKKINTENKPSPKLQKQPVEKSVNKKAPPKKTVNSLFDPDSPKPMLTKKLPPHIISTQAEIHPIPNQFLSSPPRLDPIKVNVQDPCSIRCSSSVGSVPSVQCNSCLCLYHPQCAKNSGTDGNFICKNCLNVTDTIVINPNQSPKPSTSSSDSSNSSSYSSNKDTPKPDSMPSPQYFRINNFDALKPVQNLCIINGKKFIVIPKDNRESFQVVDPRTGAAPKSGESTDESDEEEPTDNDMDDLSNPKVARWYMLTERHRRKCYLLQQRKRRLFMDTTCTGYSALTQIFQYLPINDLVRVRRVCRMWNDLAMNPLLWKKVSLKKIWISDWDAFVDTLNMRGTQHLDLKDVIIDGDADEVWCKVMSVLPKITSLLKLELSGCPVPLVEEIMKSCPNLQVLNATSLKTESISLEPANNLSSCRELRLKSVSGIVLHDNLDSLSKLINLTHLSLTAFKDLGKKHIEVLKFLTKLESLELGECTEFPEKFGSSVLSELTNLKHLRLEKGQQSVCTFNLLESISKLEHLTRLELINFDVKSGFDNYMGMCKNLKRLLFIPTYVSQAGTTNNMLLAGVIKLADTLTHFAWGVTKEILKTTELFADQYSKVSQQITEDSIPVLKPVPRYDLIEDDDNKDGKKDSEDYSNPQVEIMALSRLQKLLLNAMPKTRIKILKIHYFAACKQNLSSCAF